MLFNCQQCAKTITTKMDCCPYCQVQTKQFAIALEQQSQNKLLKDHLTLYARLKGGVGRIIWQIGG